MSGFRGLLKSVAVGAALLLLGSVFAACQDESQGGAPHRTVAEGLAQDTSWGTFHVKVVPQPNPIPFNQLFGLAITVSPAKDPRQVLDDATVAVDARMPAHNHGMNLQPRVTPAGAGTFRADGLLFHMPGTWELYVDVTRAAEMERATFVINVE